jgi:hypothetical protein
VGSRREEPQAERGKHPFLALPAEKRSRERVFGLLLARSCFAPPFGTAPRFARGAERLGFVPNAHFFFGEQKFTCTFLLPFSGARVRSAIFFSEVQYISQRTVIPMNTRTQTLPLGASSNVVSANPQD